MSLELFIGDTYSASGLRLVSIISETTLGGSYVWTPSTSPDDGEYMILVSPAYNGSFTGNATTTLDHNKTDDSISTSSLLSMSSITSASSLMGLNSSLGPTTATVTSGGNPASASSAPEPFVNVIKQSISDGAIAGIVVGNVVFILLISSSVWLCWRRRHRSPQNPVLELPNNHTDLDTKTDPGATVWDPELDQDGAVYGPHELPGTPPPLDEPLEAIGENLAEGRVVEIGDSK